MGHDCPRYGEQEDNDGNCADELALVAVLLHRLRLVLLARQQESERDCRDVEQVGNEVGIRAPRGRLS